MTRCPSRSCSNRRSPHDGVLFAHSCHARSAAAARRRADALLPVVFFAVAVGLFLFGVGPQPQPLRQIAPGVVWVGALLSAMLSVTQLYASDLTDGSLEQMLLAWRPAWRSLAAAMGTAHWLYR